MLTNLSIHDISPERVYVFPERLTRDEIKQNVSKLHTIANEQADRNIYCLFDEVAMDKALKFEVCFPVKHLDLNRYDKNDFKVLQRNTAVTCDFSGDFTELTTIIAQLKKHAEEQGYRIIPPYRFLFTIHKKSLFSTQAQKFSMQIHIPVEKHEEMSS